MTPAAGRWVSVGRVGRPHGLDGSFFVERPSEDPGRFVIGARVYVGREPATVAGRKHSGGRLVVRLDRDAPRGAELELPAAELPATGPGEYYAFQLEGLSVLDDAGRPLGRVRRVDPGVANDVLVLDTGLALPLVEDCVLAVDLDAGRVTIARAYTGSGE